jgi:hypothetical protein
MTRKSIKEYVAAIRDRYQRVNKEEKVSLKYPVKILTDLSVRNVVETIERRVVLAET